RRASYSTSPPITSASSPSAGSERTPVTCPRPRRVRGAARRMHARIGAADHLAMHDVRISDTFPIAGLARCQRPVLASALVSTDPSPASLTEAQIEQIAQRYKLEMVRYEGAARFVEQRLRRELREAAIPALLSSRAKHPGDVREKL